MDEHGTYRNVQGHKNGQNQHFSCFHRPYSIIVWLIDVILLLYGNFIVFNKKRAA